MKYMVQRNGFKYIETRKGSAPKDYLAVFNDEIPLQDVQFAIVKKKKDKDGFETIEITVDKKAKKAHEDEKKVIEADKQVKKDLKEEYKKKLKKGKATIQDLNEIVLQLIKLI